MSFSFITKLSLKCGLVLLVCWGDWVGCDTLTAFTSVAGYLMLLYSVAVIHISFFFLSIQMGNFLIIGCDDVRREQLKRKGFIQKGWSSVLLHVGHTVLGNCPPKVTVNLSIHFPAYLSWYHQFSVLWWLLSWSNWLWGLCATLIFF